MVKIAPFLRADSSLQHFERFYRMVVKLRYEIINYFFSVRHAPRLQ